ncbi:MAG TPA: translation initiation factor III [Actinoplanes sp.]
MILVVSVLAAIWAVAMMTAVGRVGYVYFFMYAEFYMGVIALVSLSITIMVGLVATDRLVLSIRQRVMLQSTHRTTGVIAVTALVVHVWTKVVEDHIGVIDVFIPFLAQGNRLYVGLGTISGWVMILVMWTGIARSRFIGRGSPWMWRGIHAISYLMWPIALMHGLSAGRAAKPWVIVSYLVCILLVLVGLAVRVSVSLNRRKDFASTATGAVKPVGRLVPTTAPVKKRARSERDELAPVAVLDTFRPVTPPPPPPVAAPVAQPAMREEMIIPASRGGRYDDEMAAPAPRQRRAMADEPTRAVTRRAVELQPDDRPRGRRYADDGEIEFDEPTARGRRYAMDDTGARTRRPGPEDTRTRMRRPAMDDTGPLRPAFDGAPAPRPRRFADDEPTPRPRRRAEEPDYDDAPRRPARGAFDELPRARGQRFEEEPHPRSGGFEPRYNAGEDDAPRGRRDRAAGPDGADPGRHSRGQQPAADDAPTMVGMGSRRARRGKPDPVRVEAGRGTRGGGRGPVDDDADDDAAYWAQLRGDAN